MGYNTNFEGRLKIVTLKEPKIDIKTIIEMVNGLSTTRRMSRDLNKIKDTLEYKPQVYGKNGEFYYNKNDNNYGQTRDDSILEYNSPPPSQPSLWLQWVIETDINPKTQGELPLGGKRRHSGVNKEEYFVQWDENEKFYEYEEWLVYLSNNLLLPSGYGLKGNIKWQGESNSDKGTIKASIKIEAGQTVQYLLSQNNKSRMSREETKLPEILKLMNKKHEPEITSIPPNGNLLFETKVEKKKEIKKAKPKV